jgi:hypothetical protein
MDRVLREGGEPRQARSIGPADDQWFATACSLLNVPSPVVVSTTSPSRSIAQSVSLVGTSTKFAR